VITAYGGEKIRKTVFDTGADHYLEKPVSPQRIREVLGTMGIYD
jgi:CheY-like chemotaxis protein